MDPKPFDPIYSVWARENRDSRWGKGFLVIHCDPVRLKRTRGMSNSIRGYSIGIVGFVKRTFPFRMPFFLFLDPREFPFQRASCHPDVRGPIKINVIRSDYLEESCQEGFFLYCYVSPPIENIARRLNQYPHRTDFQLTSSKLSFLESWRIFVSPCLSCSLNIRTWK